MDSENSAIAESIWRSCLCQRNYDAKKNSDASKETRATNLSVLGITHRKEPKCSSLELRVAGTIGPRLASYQTSR